MLDQMLEYLHSLKITDNYNQTTSLTEESFRNFKDTVEICHKVIKKRCNKNTEYCW